MKILILLGLVAIACMKHEPNEIKSKQQLPEEIKVVPKTHYKEFFKSEEAFRLRKENTKIFLPHKKPIALVYHVNINTIFHCSSLSYSECGLTAECGPDTLSCIKNTKVEYLNRSTYGINP